MPECQQCPQVGPGGTGPGPKARGVDLFSRASRVLVRAPAVDQVSRVTRAPARCPTGSTSCPARLGPWLEGPQCRPRVQDDSCSDARAHEVDPMVFGHWGPGPVIRGFDQISRVTSASARGPAVSTACPGRLRPGSKDLLLRTALPGHSQMCARARGVNQPCRATRACVLGHAESTRCPRRLWSRTEGAQGSTGCHGRQGPGPRACGVSRLSQGTRASARGPAGSTSFPG